MSGWRIDDKSGAERGKGRVERCQMTMKNEIVSGEKKKKKKN